MKKKYDSIYEGISLSLGKCQMPKIIREREWEGVAAPDKGIFPVLQHGLCELRLCIRGQCAG
jgi:hypothetical protein